MLEVEGARGELHLDSSLRRLLLDQVLVLVQGPAMVLALETELASVQEPAKAPAPVLESVGGGPEVLMDL